MEEIAKKFQLVKKFRGYQTDQVDKIITDLIIELENAKHEANQYKEEYTKAKNDVAILSERIELLKKDVETSKYHGEEITRIALKEANVLIEKAKRNADLILAESMQNLRAVNKDIEQFKKEAVHFRSDVSTLSKDLLKKIEHSHVYFLTQNDKTDQIDESFEEDEYPFIK